MTENDPTIPTPTAASCRSRMTPEGVYELRDAGGCSYPQVIRVAGGVADGAQVFTCRQPSASFVCRMVIEP